MDMKMFMYNYWDWKNISSNLLALTLGFGSLAFYIYILLLANKVSDISPVQSFSQSGLLTVLVFSMMFFLVLFTIYRVRELFKETEELIRHLYNYRKFRFYKSGIEFIQSFEWMKSSIGIYFDAGLSGLSWLSDHLLKKGFDKEAKKAILEFILITSGEYGFRMIMIILGIYLCSGEIRIW